MKKRIITISVMVLSLAMIAIGIIESQYQGVLSKAINICLESIGIG